jgi:hypothetical protein
MKNHVFFQRMNVEGLLASQTRKARQALNVGQELPSNHSSSRCQLPPVLRHL